MKLFLTLAFITLLNASEVKSDVPKVLFINGPGKPLAKIDTTTGKVEYLDGTDPKTVVDVLINDVFALRNQVTALTQKAEHCDQGQKVLKKK